MSKKLVVVMMLVVALMSSVLVSGIALAGDDDAQPALVQITGDDGGLIAIFADGRLNGLDMTESVAVYYDYEVVYYTNDDGEREAREAISAIELWVVDETTSEGQLALYVPIAEVEAAQNSSTDVTIASANGVSLGYSPSAGMLWVSGPRDYSFTWAL